jgi:hypothetical protein
MPYKMRIDQCRYYGGLIGDNTKSATTEKVILDRALLVTGKFEVAVRAATFVLFLEISPHVLHFGARLTLLQVEVAVIADAAVVPNDTDPSRMRAPRPDPYGWRESSEQARGHRHATPRTSINLRP